MLLEVLDISALSGKGDTQHKRKKKTTNFQKMRETIFTQSIFEDAQSVGAGEQTGYQRLCRDAMPSSKQRRSFPLVFCPWSDNVPRASRSSRLIFFSHSAAISRRSAERSWVAMTCRERILFTQARRRCCRWSAHPPTICKHGPPAGQRCR